MVIILCAVQSLLNKIHYIQVSITGIDHSHLTNTRTNIFLIAHSITKHLINALFRGLIRLWNELPTVIRYALNVTRVCKWPEQVVFF